MNKLFMTTILCMALVLMPFAGVFGAGAPVDIRQVNKVTENFTDATGTDDYTVITAPSSAETYGKVAYFTGSKVQYQTAIKNTYKLKGSIDFYLGDASGYLTLYIRATSPTEEKSVCTIKATSGDIEVGQWYHAEIIVDYANSSKSVIVTDTSGTEVYTSTGAFSISAGKTPSHFRFYMYGPIYIDNYILDEYVSWPQLESVTGANGEPNPVYTNNKVILTMTEDMGTVKAEDMEVLNNLTGNAVNIDSVSVDGKKIIVTTADKLQSSVNYTITLFSTATMKYGSYALGDSYTATFTTSARDLDITDVTFTSDASGVTFVANLANVTASDASPVMLVSAFDSEGRITGINQIAVDVSAGSDATSAPLRIPVTSGGYVKVLGIADFNTLAPINNNIYTFRLE